MLDKGSIQAASMFDTLDVGIIVVDRHNNVVVWNEWIARASRLAAASVIGRSLYDAFPMLVGTRLQSVVEDSFQVGSSSILTHSLNSLLPLKSEAGEELLHNIVVRPVAACRSPLCLLQINDVTLFVTRERVLRERQNARYHAIVDTAPDAIITTGVDRTIQWMNAAAGHVFGYAPTELLGRKIDNLLAGDNNATAIFSLDQHRGSAHPVIARRKGGELVPFEMSFARWKSDDRVFVTTIWRNVAERMVAERALRDSEESQRALLEALPQLVWTSAADGRCDYLNPQWQRYTGVEAEAHFGWRWLEVVHPDDRKAVETAWRTSLNERSGFNVEARLRNADGFYRWFMMRSIAVHGTTGSLTRWFGTATEITDLVEARESLRQSNEELEARVAERTREREVALAQLYESQKMETIGQLTGGVAHDFNNLLAVVLGSLTLLKKALPEDPRTSRLIDGALQGAERGATLTKRLLAFARRQELKLEAVDIQKLVPDMLDFLRQSVGPNVEIRFDIAADVQPVKIDANQLELALINLAVNARDAMPRGGTITIRCRNETADRARLPKTLPSGEYVRLSVVDTGEGMNATTRDRAMEPFFTTKGIGKGTGLGLSTVHGLTAQSGGAMEISSQLGEGTVVTLWLPRASSEDARHGLPSLVVAPHDDSGQRKLRILLVDDDPLVSMNTAYMLMDLGHSVFEANSAAQALQVLSSDSRFDMVITDYAMPGMNGLDLARQILQNTPRLPIILATGYAEFSENTTVIFPRLSKPYTQDQLAEKLDIALNEAACDRNFSL